MAEPCPRGTVMSERRIARMSVTRRRVVALLVLSDEHGAVIQEAAPPKR